MLESRDFWLETSHNQGCCKKDLISLKHKLTWSKEEDEESHRNSQALNALYNGVDQNIFKLINTCSSAKEAWNILEVAYEGTYKIKISRLQILTSKFEAFKMAKDESMFVF